MKPVEVVCQNCRTINKLDLNYDEIIDDRSLVGLSVECDGCSLDIHYDIELELSAITY